MDWVDSHAHIYLNEFDNDREEAIDRSKKMGVGRVLMPAVDSSTHAAMLELEAGHITICSSMMGLHPCSVKENFEEELAIVEKYLSQRKFVAVGEIGLDFYWDVSFQDQQYMAFRRQIEWALQYDIPISIHSRNATDECIRVVQEHQNGKLKGVFHCFSGNVEQAKKVVDAGFYLGIGGVLTFKNSGLDQVVKAMDPAYMILETDAPYLAPVPHRGKRNECSYIPLIGQKLADCMEMEIEKIAAITTANTEKLFALKA